MPEIITDHLENNAVMSKNGFSTVQTSQWSTGGRILTGAEAGEPQSSRGRGWLLKFGRGTLNFSWAGGSMPKCSQKLKPEFDSNLDDCRSPK